jgi:hypothetical protein
MIGIVRKIGEQDYRITVLAYPSREKSRQKHHYERKAQHSPVSPDLASGMLANTFFQFSQPSP